ncbi:MAG: O-antigen ligase family protein, partial [Planctomycetaceae bacterium]|nr:O-antigen ligase family protein [Planctomycetaceae bacterium]
AWRIFRSLFRDPPYAGQAIAVVIAIVVGLSCYGIWQHHVFYAEQAEWYLNLRNELDQVLASRDAAHFNRLNEITRQFQERDIPVSGAGRILWENRLLNSSEPFATFSLANTLAGILAAGLVLLFGQVFTAPDQQQKNSRLRTLTLTIEMFLIAYCLILTKSRSAWLGTAVGLSILFLRRIRLPSVKYTIQRFIGGGFIAATVVVIAIVVGGIDKEVILESPRSLQFRLFYWVGTAKLLRNFPLTGAGPGNFRQVYLQYKSDETSEEIRDPHNFVLDAWSSSGMIGLAGLLLITGWILWQLLRDNVKRPAEEIGNVTRRPPPGDRPLQTVTAGILGGFLLQIAWNWLNGSDEWTTEPTRLLLLGGLLLAFLRGGFAFTPVDSAACLAAVSAVMVNLMAASGFEIPTVMLTVLVCLAAAVGGNGGQTPFAWRHWNLVGAGLCLMLGCVVVKFGLMPVTLAAYHVRAGNMLVTGPQNTPKAVEQFQDAAHADPQSVTPRQRLVEVLAYPLSEAVFLRATSREREGFDEADRRLADEALDACERLIVADRRNSFSYGLRAEVRWNAAIVKADKQLQNLAIQDLKTAVQLYPSSTAAWYNLAQRLAATTINDQDEAKKAARRALQLDELNHAWGHSDRFLADEQRKQIERMAGL